MQVNVYGLGYVGVVCSAYWASSGHRVTGIDINRTKVDLINAGKSPIVEPGLAEMLASVTSAGTLVAKQGGDDDTDKAEISVICVGTPSQLSGNIDLSALRRVCEDIGTRLRDMPQYHVVVVRSTVPPGTVSEIVAPTLEEFSGKKIGADFGVAANPEFLREGSAIADFKSPSKTVIGAMDKNAFEAVKALYDGVEGDVVQVDIPVAEMIKYADNSWHALKVAFANEMGSVAKAKGVDGPALMQLFCSDTKLNIAPTYLRPGFAFGGSCLPKDVRAINYFSRSGSISTPVLDAILPSNAGHIERALELVKASDGKRVGVFGLAFKDGTDDLRESPIVDLVEHLLGKGYDIQLIDPNVSMAALTGANKDYLLNHIPHVTRLLRQDPKDLVENSDILVVASREASASLTEHGLGKQHTIVDLVGIDGLRDEAGRYHGICW